MIINEVQKEIDEYNKTAYVDEQTIERNARGYSNDKVLDERIPPVSSKVLVEPFDQIEDERLKLILKRDYASLMQSLSEAREKTKEYREKLEMVYPTSILRFTGIGRDKLEAENRLYYTEDGNQCIILPKSVKLRLTDKNK